MFDQLSHHLIKPFKFSREYLREAIDKRYEFFRYLSLAMAYICFRVTGKALDNMFGLAMNQMQTPGILNFLTGFLGILAGCLLIHLALLRSSLKSQVVELIHKKTGLDSFKAKEDEKKVLTLKVHEEAKLGSENSSVKTP